LWCHPHSPSAISDPVSFSTALLVFLATAARAGIVSTHLGIIAFEGDHLLRKQTSAVQNLRWPFPVEGFSRSLQPFVVESLELVIHASSIGLTIIPSLLTEGPEVSH
jgi:hypothetical protein